MQKVKELLKKEMILNVCLFVTVLMIFVSIGVVGANLNYTLYLQSGINVGKGSYMHSQGAILAFDVLLMIAIPALIYSTFYAKKMHNLFVSIIYQCFMAARWISGVVFLADSTYASSLATNIGKLISAVPGYCAQSQCTMANCAQYYQYKSAYSEQIASVILFILFGFLPMPLSMMINKERGLAEEAKQ